MGYIVTGGRILRNTHCRLRAREEGRGNLPWDITPQGMMTHANLSKYKKGNYLAHGFIGISLS